MARLLELDDPATESAFRTIVAGIGLLPVVDGINVTEEPIEDPEPAYAPSTPEPEPKVEPKPKKPAPVEKS